MKLPIFQTADKTLQLLQTSWASILAPILKNPANSPIILQNVSLKTGSNTVNHLLGRTLQGWYLVRLKSAATIYDNQDSNPSPQLTLVLISSADAVVDIAVF